jgi:SAM-dependent methyltransferase
MMKVAARQAASRCLAAFAVVLLCSSVWAQAPAKPYEPRVGQAGKDVIWVPMPDDQLNKLLDMANVTRADYVIDLGSGDGRTVVAAAKRGAHALGVEFNPDLVEFSRREAQKAGVADKAAFEQGDLFKADLSRATVISLFLLQEINLKLRPALLRLKPGTRIVTNTFHMGDWKADVAEHFPPGCHTWCDLYLWIIPAHTEGTWKAPQGALVLRQHFQEISGTLGTGPAAVAITGKVEGERIRFSAGGSQYSGQVHDKTIEGTVNTGSGIRPWKAVR